MSTYFCRTMVQVVLVLLTCFATPILSSAQELQVELLIAMSTDSRSHVKFTTPIQPGSATLSGTVSNLQGRATVGIDLVFDYIIPQGPVAFDEQINRIEITTETQEGEIFGCVIIDTQIIFLNPNRVPLFYYATLYYPEYNNAYVVRIRVFGSYV